MNLILGLKSDWEDRFIEFYKGLYGDTSKETGTGELPVVNIKDYEKHVQMWKAILVELLGGEKKANSVYKKRPYGYQTKLQYMFSWLWLGYGPKFVNDDGSVAAWEDVCSFKDPDLDYHKQTKGTRKRKTKE